MGSLLIFGNSINPDIQTNGIQGELSRYAFKDKVQLKKKQQVVSAFSSAGADGLGITLQTTHRDFKNWSNHLNLRYYRNSDYHLTFYTVGFNYFTRRPRVPVELSVGGEIGIGSLESYQTKKWGTVRDTLGWEVSTGVQSYFIGFDRLWNYFVRPSLRSYHFSFDGKRGVKDETIDGQGFVIAAGLGLRF